MKTQKQKLQSSYNVITNYPFPKLQKPLQMSTLTYDNVVCMCDGTGLEQIRTFETEEIKVIEK